MAIKITFTENGKVIGEDELTDEEVKALNTDVETVDFKHPISGEIYVGIVGWILNAYRDKVRTCIDDIVTLSGRGSKHTDIPKKYQIMKDLDAEKSPLLKSAKVIQAEWKAKQKEWKAKQKAQTKG